MPASDALTPLALLTQHGKQAAIEQPLAPAGYRVHTVNGFDTDLLGTFTGETARKGSQLDAATSKAKIATQHGDTRYGLGSEGSFGTDPYVGMTPWAREVLVWWDALEQRSVHALAQGPATNYAQTTAPTWADAQRFAQQAGFPAHGVVVGKPGEAGFSKDCGDWLALEVQFHLARAAGPVWLETDMRAHRNPQRMAMIGLCAKVLADRLQCRCPACARVGFGVETPLAGAVCEACGAPTSAVRAKHVVCEGCGYSEDVPLQATVPASRCEHCNP